MEWVVRKTPGFEDFFTVEKEFNNTTYLVTIFVWDYPKSIKFHVGLSSGNKRSDLLVFEEKDKKSNGGMKALLWVKEAVNDFPVWYSKRYSYLVKGKSLYTCIGWADNRRRNIYSRLQKEGFQFMMDEGKKVLMKKFVQ